MCKGIHKKVTLDEEWNERGPWPRWYNHFILEGCWEPNIKSEMINCDGYNSRGNKTVNSGARVHPGMMILVTWTFCFKWKCMCYRGYINQENVEFVTMKCEKLQDYISLGISGCPNYICIDLTSVCGLCVKKYVVPAYLIAREPWN